MSTDNCGPAGASGLDKCRRDGHEWSEAGSHWRCFECGDAEPMDYRLPPRFTATNSPTAPKSTAPSPLDRPDRPGLWYVLPYRSDIWRSQWVGEHKGELVYIATPGQWLGPLPTPEEMPELLSLRSQLAAARAECEQSRREREAALRACHDGRLLLDRTVRGLAEIGSAAPSGVTRAIEILEAVLYAGRPIRAANPDPARSPETGGPER